MKNILVLLIFLVVLVQGCTEPKTDFPAPANQSATPEAKALLSFLYSIKGKYTLSGQHNFVSSGSRYNEKVFEITGKYQVIWGSDLSFNVIGDSAKNFHHCGPMNLSDPMDAMAFNGLSPGVLRSNLIEEIKLQSSKGHIITLMWHHCYPAFGDSCQGSEVWRLENRPSRREWDSLVTEGTTLNKQWKAQVDHIIPYLKQLKEAKIPVLWRPYHEMNGVWFWWCNQKGDEGFRRLWIMMYKYFVEVHHLDNLLWVWNTNAPRDIPGDEAFQYGDFFPGTAYVDVLAADVYRKDYKQSHHDDLLKLAEGKLIALGEIGEVPSPEQLVKQPYWSWMMPWGYFINKYNKPEDVKAIYNSPQVLTLDEVVYKNNEWEINR